MSYNKISIKRKIQTTDSRPAKIKNKFIVSCIKVVMTVIIVFAIIMGSTGLGVAKGIIDSAPDISDINVTPTGYSTTVYAADGKSQIATLVGSGANRKYVTIDEIPLHTQHAFVAIEDSRFYEHNGIDLYGIARAFVAGLKDILSGRSPSQGASTITQQLIKNNVLTTWVGESAFIETVQRKIQEQYLALKLEEQVQDKDWILENYLNTINLGSNTLGIQAAANRYFGKDVSELTLSESAVIAGITKMPYSYNPITNPEKNAERREKVLRDMLAQGYISKEEYDEALADNVYDRIAIYNSNNEASYNTYFVDALIDDVIDDLVEIKGYTETEAYKALYQGGLTIVSTQDLNIQKIVDEEVNNEANYSDKVQYSFMLNFRVKKADGTYKTHTHYSMLTYYQKKNGNHYNLNFSSEEKCYEAIEQYKKEILEEGDTIVDGTESVYITLQPQVALTVMDQYTGEVKALVGGRGEKEGNRTLNRATDTTRQPGSTFKILACYAPAIDAAGYTLATVQDDCELIIGDKTYRNSDDLYHGLSTVREAIIDSYNIAALKTMQDIGAGLGLEYAKKFGFTTLSDSDRTLSLTLGGLTNGVKNIELTAAYAAIANGGEYIEPSYYTHIYDHDGNLILDNSQKERHRVISEQTAFLLTDALQDVMTMGTGKKYAYFGSTMAQAGKTGTTTAARDSLFAGYTPYYTCAVWGGFDDNSTQTNLTTTYCRKIWRESMRRIHEGLPYKSFNRPSKITTATVCKDSGLVPLDGICTACVKGNSVYTEYFALGTVPVSTCNHHIKIDICNTTGQLASNNCVFTTGKVYIYGANPLTIDEKYIVSDEFLQNICNVHGTPIIPTPGPDVPLNPDTPDNPGDTDDGDGDDGNLGNEDGLGEPDLPNDGEHQDGETP